MDVAGERSAAAVGDTAWRNDGAMGRRLGVSATQSVAIYLFCFLCKNAISVVILLIAVIQW